MQICQEMVITLIKMHPLIVIQCCQNKPEAVAWGRLQGAYGPPIEPKW